jgi:hypothetical protein
MTATNLGAGMATTDPTGDALVADLIAAHDQGLETETYLAARDTGATHEQIKEFIAASDAQSLYLYTGARRQGMGHTLMIECAALAQDSKQFNSILRMVHDGFDVTELATYVRQASQAGVSPAPVAYVKCRNKGITHDQFMDVSDLGTDMEAYCCAIDARALHTEAYQVITEGHNLKRYA